MIIDHRTAISANVKGNHYLQGGVLIPDGTTFVIKTPISYKNGICSVTLPDIAHLKYYAAYIDFLAAVEIMSQAKISFIGIAPDKERNYQLELRDGALFDYWSFIMSSINQSISALEAYINSCIDRLGQDEFCYYNSRQRRQVKNAKSEVIRNLSIEEKITLILPQIIFGNNNLYKGIGNSKNKKSFDKFKELYKIRNDLEHPKPKNTRYPKAKTSVWEKMFVTQTANGLKPKINPPAIVAKVIREIHVEQKDWPKWLSYYN